uniref:Uncharacterized protein n=1 Tax=Fagus sylvatica TaxID=28930 RepID=A0A2N9HVE5_FAGSY
MGGLHRSGGIWVGFADVVTRPKAAWVMLGTSRQWVEVWPGMVAINGTLHRERWCGVGFVVSVIWGFVAICGKV